METINDFITILGDYWKHFGDFLGEMIGRIFLMVFYITIMLPFGLGASLFGDLLDTKKSHLPRWMERKSSDTSLDAALDQGLH